MNIFMAMSGCDLQHKLLYYPNSSLPSQDELVFKNMQFWPSGPVNYKGFIGNQAVKNLKGTIIVFHGNAGTAADRAYYLTAMGQLGYLVILAEYPGYGARAGELGENSFVSDAKETIRLAYQQYGAPIFLLGESLGCGVVAAVVNKMSIKIDGVVLITPWDSLLSVAQSKFPWLPVRLFMKDKYDSMRNLKSYMGRIAVAGAERDEIIPIRHANTLYQSLDGNKAMWVIKGAGHNDWPNRVDLHWWQTIMGFVNERNPHSQDSLAGT